VLNDGDLSLLNQNRKPQFRQNRGCIYGLSCREKLKDERTGLTHDFTRKDGVAHSEIISNLDIEIDRSELWNLAEKSENRKDARTAREWVIALPDELDADQRKDLAKAFATALVDRYGVIADLAIHEPSKGGNDKNHHAHIMLTTRKAN
jgi:ATP-dependent exoDNAse (exonuclease V) alpha subunit